MELEQRSKARRAALALPYISLYLPTARPHLPYISKARRAALALHEPLPVAQIAYVSQYLGVDSVVQVGGS